MATVIGSASGLNNDQKNFILRMALTTGVVVSSKRGYRELRKLFEDEFRVEISDKVLDQVLRTPRVIQPEVQETIIEKITECDPTKGFLEARRDIAEQCGVFIDDVTFGHFYRTNVTAKRDAKPDIRHNPTKLQEEAIRTGQIIFGVCSPAGC